MRIDPEGPDKGDITKALLLELVRALSDIWVLFSGISTDLAGAAGDT
jgi:hypothetical protein